jgi:phosphatidylglycerophosphatase C
VSDGPTAGRRVAVFDLDGTITWRDSLLPFLAGVLRRHPARLARLAPLPWALARYAIDRDRGRLKGALIRYALGGLRRDEVHGEVEAFLPEFMRRGLRPAALAAIERHRAAGDRLVLLSASPDLYVPAIGRRLGFDEVICTELRWDGERLHGYLESPNRHGPEKRRVVESLRTRLPGATFAAYGNATSDLDHLAIVERPCLVNGSAAARRRASALGIPVGEWQ